MAVGQKENPWGPQVLFFPLTSRVFWLLFLTHSQIPVVGSTFRKHVRTGHFAKEVDKTILKKKCFEHVSLCFEQKTVTLKPIIFSSMFFF